MQCFDCWHLNIISFAPARTPPIFTLGFISSRKDFVDFFCFFAFRFPSYIWFHFIRPLVVSFSVLLFVLVSGYCFCFCCCCCCCCFLLCFFQSCLHWLVFPNSKLKAWGLKQIKPINKLLKQYTETTVLSGKTLIPYVL